MPGLDSERWTRRLELAILAAGIGARTVRYLEPRPLWIDEVLIALNVLPHGPADYLQPLGYAQLSPFGFLLGEWLVTRVAGPGEHALRLLPFIASVAALILFARLARRTLESGTALLAIALVALSPLLIVYAGELKSYSFDFLCALLLMHATLSLAEDPTPRRWMVWSVTAAFGALMSTPAPFFIAGCAMAMLAVPAMRNVKALLRLAAATLPAALLFAGQYFTTYDSPFTRMAMESYWTRQFLEPRLPEALTQGAQLARTIVMDATFGDRVAESLPRKSMTIMLLLTVVGAALLARRSPRVGVLVLAPAAVVAVAALMHRWPLTSRLLLFLVPALAMGLASGVAALTRPIPDRIRGVALSALSLLILVGGAAGTRAEWNENTLVIALPEALRAVQQNKDSNVTVYFSSDLVPACRYYLAWHPDRAELGGGVDLAARADTTAMCSVKGATTVAGQWPMFVRRTPDMAWNAPRPIQPEWLDTEGARILAATESELWMLLGHSRQLHESLPVWMEAHGLRRSTGYQKRTLLVLRYAK